MENSFKTVMAPSIVQNVSLLRVLQNPTEIALILSYAAGNRTGTVVFMLLLYSFRKRLVFSQEACDFSGVGTFEFLLCCLAGIW